MLLTVLHNCTLYVMTFAVLAFAIYDRWIENSKVWSRKTDSTERVLRSIIWCCVFMYRNCWKLNSCIMWWWKMLTNSKTYIPILTKKCKAHQGIFFGIPYFSKKEAQTSVKYTTLFDYYKIKRSYGKILLLCSTFKNDQKNQGIVLALSNSCYYRIIILLLYIVLTTCLLIG